jgi:hypothetical protein
VDGTTGDPIAEAVVALIPPGGRGAARGALPAGGSPEMQQAMEAALAAAAASRGGTGPQRVMTGADGRFVFHSLPPGNFQLTATLTGYTSSLGVSLSPAFAGVVGGVSATPSSTTLPLKEGEFATGVTLRLWKFGVISGTVLDDRRRARDWSRRAGGAPSDGGRPRPLRSCVERSHGRSRHVSNLFDRPGRLPRRLCRKRRCRCPRRS